MSEMIERVARALYDGDSGVAHVGFVGWDEEPDSDSVGRRPAYRRRARAAITAMREPTEAMKDALQSYACCAGYIDEGWAAAFDEALR